MARNWPIPDTTNLLHFIGDMHHGGITAARSAKMLADLNSKWCPKPVARVFVGDMVDDGLTAMDTTAKTWLAGITDGAPYYTICGNHDILHNIRTVADWQAVWGYATQNYTADFVSGGTTFARGIFLSPDILTADTTSILLSSTTLSYLDAQLAATSLDCIVVAHAPLYNTVLGGASYHQSTDGAFWVQNLAADADSSAITSVLAAHSNARAYFSGHTHSDIDVTGLMTTPTLGGKKVAVVNCSALQYTGKTIEATDPLYTLYVNYYPGDHLNIKFRNHGAGVWYGPAGQRDTTLALT